MISKLLYSVNINFKIDRDDRKAIEDRIIDFCIDLLIDTDIVTLSNCKVSSGVISFTSESIPHLQQLVQVVESYIYSFNDVYIVS